MNAQCFVQHADSDPRLQRESPPDDLLSTVAHLHRTEVEAGTVANDVAQLEYYRYTHPDHGFPLLAQFNPKRAARPFDPETCPVCLSTVRRQGRQRYLSISVNARPYVVLANTFPAMPGALVILTAEHTPQTLDPRIDRWQQSGIHRAISDMVALAGDLPGYLVIFNGRDAGASLQHFHYQAFQVPAGHGSLPLQQLTHSSDNPWIGYTGDYPIAVHCARGSADSVISSSTAVATAWWSLQGSAATANLVATATAEGIELWLVPRNAAFKVGLLGGPLGAIEAAGMSICSSAQDRERIRSGKVDFKLLWRNLALIRPSAAEELRANFDGTYSSHGRARQSR